MCTFHEYCFPLRLKSPVNRQHSRDTLTSTANGYYGSGHLHSSISKPEPYDRDKMVSPPYNRLGESPIPNGVISPIGIKTDSVIDMPDNSIDVPMIQTHFSSGQVVPNPQYNRHIPGQPSSRPQHVQLQTSLSDLQPSTDSPSPDKQYPESLMSEKQFLSNSHLLNVPTLSKSNPTVSSY